MIKSKEDLIGKLTAYAHTPDDYVSQFKEKIRYKLLRCPELLYALHCEKLESELFDEDGNINAEFNEQGEVVEPFGAWDEYFGYIIRPYIPFIKETQESAENFLFYEVSLSEIPRYNKVECVMHIAFSILCSTASKYVIDDATGLARHDLIASIIREKFNWSNIFGTQCKLVENYARVTDSNYITRYVTFECTLLNSIVNTPYNGQTTVINNKVRK